MYGCGDTKPLWDFYVAATNKSGKPRYMSHCKACDNKRRAVQAKLSEQHKVPTVYMLLNRATGEFYIGSTTLTLRKRWWNHKTAAFTDNEQSQLYHCMRCFNDDKYWEIKPLHTLPGASTAELREAEQDAIEELNPVLNTNNAVREAL
jgi:hypothetical protein